MATNKIQCPYGHFYNADKYEECPVCNKGMLSASGVPASESPKKITTASQSQFSQEPISVPVQVRNSYAYSPTESVFGNQYEDTKPRSAIDKTVSIMDDIPSITPDIPPSQQPQQIQEPILSPASTPPHEVEEAAPTNSSLQAAVNAVVSHKDTEDVKTVALWNAPAGAEPVVGWLVCVKGEYFGQSFNLKTGNNTVGRAMNMDIPLAQEPSVSRNKHCVITFEPQNHIFYIQQGESSGLTYLNGEMIMAPTKMNEHDSIKLGAAEFLLIPFCTTDFKWENYTI